MKLFFRKLKRLFFAVDINCTYQFDTPVRWAALQAVFQKMSEELTGKGHRHRASIWVAVGDREITIRKDIAVIGRNAMADNDSDSVLADIVLAPETGAIEIHIWTELNGYKAGFLRVWKFILTIFFLMGVAGLAYGLLHGIDGLFFLGLAGMSLLMIWIPTFMIQEMVTGMYRLIVNSINKHK